MVKMEGLNMKMGTKTIGEFLNDTLAHKTFTTDERKKLAEDDLAMPDGSFPIRNREDLKNAIQAYGRATEKEAVKKWIIKRAKDLDAEDLLPRAWVEVKINSNGKVVDVIVGKNAGEVIQVEHTSFNDVLEHYGVKGQKWGVRRQPSRAQRRNAARKQERSATAKKRRNLSDDEIKRAIERLEAERKLRTLTDEDVSPGRAMARRVASGAGERVAKTVLTGAGLYAINVAMSRQFDPRQAAGYLAPKPKNK